MIDSPPRLFPVSGRHRELHDDHEVVTVEVDVPGELLYFVGHFPGYPILPGVAQLVPLVLAQVHTAWADLEHPRRLSRLKFRQPVFPGAHLQLRLERRGPKVRYRLLREGRACSEGTLDYPEAAIQGAT